ncbi:MAG: galactose-1-phosphate uridylyltransferase [Bacilli bacterium]|nr:galactose-1-phosphate uridylyltransferase [Bacilli bacterium]
MIQQTIEEFLYYATQKFELSELDIIYCRNRIFNILKVTEPKECEVNKEEIGSLIVPDRFVEAFSKYIEENSLYEASQIESIVTEIMAVVTPLPSRVNQRFNELKEESAVKATEYLYNLSVANYYVQKTKVDKNILWNSKDNLEISINLSKPEKNNKDIIALANNKVDVSYPKCVLCAENVGFPGRGKFVPRQNIRVVPMKLNNKDWFLQYSPYGYYDRHCILVKTNHEPMVLCEENMRALFDFVDEFPHYFIGSNSDRPIVGGSILNHEHFQGGYHVMPMMKRKVAEEYIDNEYPEIRIGKLDWYNSTIVLMSNNKESVVQYTLKVLEAWRKYSDEACSIRAYTDNESHNAITPTLVKKGNVYYMYIILRNNRCDETYPDGIFHAHPEYHHIKKEGIGLIEAMGLFILPARLVRQLGTIEEIVKNDTPDNIYLNLYPDMKDFVPMINKIKANHTDNIRKDIISEVDDVCRGILENTAVFKNDALGNEHFTMFLNSIGAYKK